MKNKRIHYPDFILQFPKANLPSGLQGETNFLENPKGQVAFHTIPKGQETPMHQHKDSWACLISGSLEFILGDDKFMADTGMSWFMPEGTLHCGRALEDTLLIEVFCEKRFAAE
jgi:quercetin dioxygenase-like cupin family protein